MMGHQLTISFFPVAFDLIVIFAKADLLILVGIAIVLLLMLFSLIKFIKEIKNMQKKDELMKEEMPEIASKFGKVISASRNTIIFERGNTIFEAKINRIDTRMGSAIPRTDYEIRFNLANLPEKFYIQNKTFFSNFSKYSSDCQQVLIPTIPIDVIFHSSNSQFLVALLEKEKVMTEIHKYLKERGQGFRIAFENDVFTITWNFGIVEDWQIEAEKLEQICQTAVVFYDELSEK